jgi:hypothetical protein
MAVSKQSIGRKKNLLHRYKIVLEEFNRHYTPHSNISAIHRDIIYPKFGISRDTLYRIFNTPIEEELEKVTLPSLFD